MKKCCTVILFHGYRVDRIFLCENRDWLLTAIIWVDVRSSWNLTQVKPNWKLLTSGTYIIVFLIIFLLFAIEDLR